MKKRIPCLVCAVVLAAAAAVAPAQKSHDALAQARSKARWENQRVLLLIAGGDQATDAALRRALGSNDIRGKLRDDYQVAALPAASLAATHLRKQLGLEDRPLPVLAALDTSDRMVGTLDGRALDATGATAGGAVAAFLDRHRCAPRDARKVLADGIAAAKKSKRQVFVYLSAPW